MHFFINSIEFLKLLNWRKKFPIDTVYMFKLNSDLNVLTVSATLPRVEGFKQFIAFQFVPVDNVVSPSFDEISVNSDIFDVLSSASPEKANQVEFVLDDYVLHIHYLDFVGRSFFTKSFDFRYVNFPPLPIEDKFDGSVSLSKAFFNFVKVCKDYLTISDDYAYSNSDTFVCRYHLPGVELNGTVAKDHLNLIAPGTYDLFVGKSYFCLLNRNDSLYLLPYTASIDSYKLMEGVFNAEYVQSTTEAIPDALGRKLGGVGFSIGRGVNNMFLLKNGLVEFLFLDN